MKTHIRSRFFALAAVVAVVAMTLVWMLAPSSSPASPSAVHQDERGGDSINEDTTAQAEVTKPVLRLNAKVPPGTTNSGPGPAPVGQRRTSAMTMDPSLVESTDNTGDSGPEPRYRATAAETRRRTTDVRALVERSIARLSRRTNSAGLSVAAKKRLEHRIRRLRKRSAVYASRIQSSGSQPE